MVNQAEYIRDDLRRTVLLKAHLDGGQWKSEAWALADSLSWALAAFGRVSAPGAETEFSDQDIAEYRLAEVRLERVRKEFSS